MTTRFCHLRWAVSFCFAGPLLASAGDGSVTVAPDKPGAPAALSAVVQPTGGPSNDGCVLAVPLLDGATPFDTTGTTTDGPDYGGNPDCGKFGDDTVHHDIWYDYQATCTGLLTLTTCEQLGGAANFDTRISIHNGCGEVPVCPAGVPLGCNDDDPTNACGGSAGGYHSTLSLPVFSGNCYKVRLGGFDSAEFGTGTLNVSCVQGPENDRCTQSIPIADGTTEFTTIGAATDGEDYNGSPDCGEFGDDVVHHDVWFDYTASCTGTLNVNTCEDRGGSADYDTRLAVHDGCAAGPFCTGSPPLACNDDDLMNECGTEEGGFHSSIDVEVVEGNCYKIRVGGFGPGVAGTGTLQVTCGSGAVPAIVHSDGEPGQTRPFSGYIDPRLESTNGTNVNLGVTTVTLEFDQPVFAVGGGPVLTSSFEVTSGAGTHPVTTVTPISATIFEVTFSPPAHLQDWTTVRAIVQNGAGVAITNAGNLGAANEPDRIDIGFLPGDIDQNRTVAPLDLLRFRQFAEQELAGGGTCASCPHNTLGGVAQDYFDTDRSGTMNPLDLLRFRQVLFGSGNATQAWQGQTLAVRP